MNLEPEETVLDKQKPLRVLTVRVSVDLHERIKEHVADLEGLSINRFCVNAILDALTAAARVGLNPAGVCDECGEPSYDLDDDGVCGKCGEKMDAEEDSEQ